MPEKIEGKTALEWYNEGFDMSLQGRYDEAIICFDRALKIDPQHAGALYNKGDALSNLGRDDEAIQCYDQAIGIKPRNTYEWVQKGLTLGLFERDAEAIISFDHALKIDPYFTSALLFKGDALRKLGRHDDAIHCYDRALEIEPDDAGAWKSKGEAFKCLGWSDEAIICYDQVLMIDPSDADAWYNKGLTLANLNLHDEAIQCYDHVLDLNPEVAGAWNNKGNVLDDLGRHDEAIECFDRALEIDPESAIAWNNKGFVLTNLGRYAEAIVCYDQVREIDPDNATTKKNRENVLRIIAEKEKQNRPVVSRSGNAPQPSRSPVQSSDTIENTGTEIAERNKQNLRGLPQFAETRRSPPAQPSVTIERTVYDPLARDFLVSTARPLVNVRNWIDRHDPASYWLIVCVHNHSDRTIDEWGIELESSSTLKILNTAIEDVAGQVPLHTTHPKPWLIRLVLGVSHHRGLVVPRNGSRRVYFRLGSESCGISHTIQGRFIADGAEAEIRAKQFLHSCDVATLEMAMQQNPALAMQFAADQLLKRYDKEMTQKLLRIFELVYDIKDCYHLKRFECIHDKLPILQNALEIGEVSDNLSGLVQRLNAMDIHDGMGGSMLELKAREAERMCRNIIEVWKNEVLSRS